jgi:DNA-binding transcriptional LysR family regulator
VNIQPFNLNLLKVLDALLSEGSTIGAAQRIGLSQPAVSSALARLRRDLADPLFVRRGPRLEPTDFALSLAASVRRIIEETERLLAGPEAFVPRLARGVVRLAGTDFFAELLIPELTRRLRVEAPGIQVQLLNLAPEDHLTMLERYNVDIALLPERNFPAWAEALPLFSAEFSVIAAKSHPELESANLATGATIPFDLFCKIPHAIMSPQGQLQTATDKHLADRGLARTVMLSLPSFTAICATVAQTDLIAVVPTHLAHVMQDRHRLRAFTPPLEIAAPTLCAVWHRSSAASPLKRYVRDISAEILASLHAGDGREGETLTSLPQGCS